MQAETRESRLYKSIELPLFFLRISFKTLQRVAPSAPNTEEALCVT
ncbi:hypothetical protein [Candidatus Parabeggiatoa sp. HSG14]|nr:hypothetical protein [Thiotrichales bacterium HSG14]